MAKLSRNIRKSRRYRKEQQHSKAKNSSKAIIRGELVIDPDGCRAAMNGRDMELATFSGCLLRHLERTAGIFLCKSMGQLLSIPLHSYKESLPIWA
ncbi:MAG: hypothetical protein ACI3XP_05330 [Eubacteriales bacterium]